MSRKYSLREVKDEVDKDLLLAAFMKAFFDEYFYTILDHADWLEYKTKKEAKDQITYKMEHGGRKLAELLRKFVY